MPYKLSEYEMENIVGGEWFSAELMATLISVFAILIAVYKMAASKKGGAKIGNDYNFYWE